MESTIFTLIDENCVDLFFLFVFAGFLVEGGTRNTAGYLGRELNHDSYLSHNFFLARYCF